MKKASNRAPIRDTKRAAPAADGLQNVVAGLGTGRDKMSYGEYGQVLTLDRNALENMYRASWLAKKIVNLPAEDMTRAWRTFQFDDESVQEDNQFAIEEAERKLCIRQKVQDAITWGRLYGGGVLLLGVGGPNDYEKLLQVEKVRKGDLKFVHAFDRHTAIAEGVIDWDLASPNFGLPKFYRIGTAQGPRVHHSRIIRFNGSRLPYLPSLSQHGWGDSELQAVYDTLRSKDTVTAGIASMVFEANVDVVKVPELTELISTKDGEQKLIKRFQLAMLQKSFNRTLLLGGDEEYDKKSNSFGSLDAILKEFRAEVAGAADIPVTRLFGTGVSGLSATGDNEVRQYYDMVASKQEMQLRPQLERLDEVLVRSALGTMPDDYRFIFGPLWQMSATEKATAETQRATRDKTYLEAGVITEGVIARQLKEDGTYSVMTEEDVSLAEELAAAMEESRKTPPPTPEELAAQAAAAGAPPGGADPANAGAPAPATKEGDDE